MLTRTQFISAAIEATKIINEAAAAATEEGLVNYVCEEVTDRLSLYLNFTDTDLFDDRIVKVAARIASGIFTQTKTNISGETDATQIKSISDNGQSVTYGDSTKNYLATVTDGELFGGCAELLKPYRKVHVVS